MKRKLLLFIVLIVTALLLITGCSGRKFSIHKVTFDADGGDLSFWDKSTNIQTYGTVELPIPTREGYVFLGWYIGEGVNEAQFTATSMVTSDITLKAKWTPAEYTVTFIDYFGNVLSRETVKHGETAPAPNVPRIAENCLRFDAWDKDISSITTDTEVKALYVVDSYSITYVTGTNQTIPTTTYFFGETPVYPPEPAMAGHYFIGWYLDQEHTTEFLFDEPLTEDLTLYAYFNESIPISTLDELLAIPEYDASHYFLKNDIDCEGAVINTQIIGFTGTLDGCGHKIHNFVFQPAAAASAGLFATNGGTIKNLYFDDFSYTLFTDSLNSSVGFVTGNNTGTIENVHISNASLSYTNQNCATNYGAVAGVNTGKVANCSVTASTLYLESRSNSWWNSGTRRCYLYGGALVGTNAGAVDNCNAQTVATFRNQNECSDGYSSGNESFVFLGGLVSVNDGSIKSSDASVEVSGSTNNYRYHETQMGGFACYNNSEIESCSSNLKVNCDALLSRLSVGGFLENNKGTVKNCHTRIEATNTVSNAAFGGFVAFNYAGIDHCYAQGTMNVGAATIGKGGFAGYNDGSINSCFTDVSITATDATNYAPFIGYYGTASYVTNCYYSIKATFGVNGQPHTFDNPNAEVGDPVLQFASTDFLTNTLGWSADIWAFDPNQLSYPTLK